MKCCRPERARGLAGGATWAQTWLLEDRQQDVYAGSCDQTLVSDPETGVVYYSLPSATNLSRSNYVSARPRLVAGWINADSALLRARPSSNHPTAGPIGSWRKSSTAPAPATPTPGSSPAGPTAARGCRSLSNEHFTRQTRRAARTTWASRSSTCSGRIKPTRSSRSVSAAAAAVEARCAGWGRVGGK